MSGQPRRGGGCKQQLRGEKQIKTDFKKRSSREEHNSVFQSLWRMKMMSVVEEKNDLEKISK